MTGRRGFVRPEDVREQMTDIVPPHSVEAERAVLGTLLIARDSAMDLADADFFLDRHRQIHAAMRSLRERADGVDLITLTEELKRRGVLEDVGGQGYLAQLVEDGSTNAHLASYVASIRDHAMARELIKLSAEMMTRAYDGGDPRAVLAQMDAVAQRVSGAGPAEAFDFEDAGSEFVATWPQFRVSMTLRRVRDHADGLKGELLVASGGRRLEQQTYSLLAAQSRAALAKHLAQAEPRLTAELWGMLLKAFAFRVHDETRRLRPELLTGQVYDGPRFDVWPFALRDELTLLFAPPGSGKSLLAIAAGLCHVTGLVLPGGIRPREALLLKRVLFLDSETTRETFDHRVGALCRGWGMPVPPSDRLHYLNIKGRVLADLTDALRAYIVRHEITLVVLDSTLWVAGHDRELSDATIGVYTALARLGVSVLALTHSSKGDAESAYGNVLYEAGARLVLKVKRLAYSKDSLTVQVSTRKGNDVQISPMTFHFDFEPGEAYTWIRLGSADGGAGATAEETPTTYRARILMALPDGKPRTPAEVSSITGIDRNIVSKELGRMAADRLVLSIGHGQWLRQPEDADE